MRNEDIVIGGYYFFGNNPFPVRQVTDMNRFYVAYNAFDSNGKFLASRANMFRSDFASHALKRVKPKKVLPTYPFKREA